MTYRNKLWLNMKRILLGGALFGLLLFAGSYGWLEETVSAVPTLPTSYDATVDISSPATNTMAGVNVQGSEIYFLGSSTNQHGNTYELTGSTSAGQLIAADNTTINLVLTD